MSKWVGSYMNHEPFPIRFGLERRIRFHKKKKKRKRGCSGRLPVEVNAPINTLPLPKSHVCTLYTFLIHTLPPIYFFFSFSDLCFFCRASILQKGVQLRRRDVGGMWDHFAAFLIFPHQWLCTWNLILFIVVVVVAVVVIHLQSRLYQFQSVSASILA